MLWAFLSIISGLGDAIMFAVMKKLKGANNSAVVWMQFAVASPFLAVFLYFDYPQRINADVYWIGVLSGILLLLSSYLLVKAAQVSKLSASMPLLSFTPLFLILTSYFMLNEIPTKSGFFGILLIVLGAYIIHIKSHQKGFLAPFKVLVEDKGSFYILIVAFMWSVTANLFKQGIIDSNPIFFSMIVYAFISVILLPIVFTKQNIRDIKSNFHMLIFLGLVSAFVVTTASYSMLVAIVPYVIALKRSSVIFAIFLGYFLFKEKGIKNALAGTIIMLIGGLLITLF